MNAPKGDICVDLRFVISLRSLGSLAAIPDFLSSLGVLAPLRKIFAGTVGLPPCIKLSCEQIFL